jgi:hypothetical protein
MSSSNHRAITPAKGNAQLEPARSFPVPPWMQAMREAAERKLTGDVMERIIDAQIRKAEQGDQRAARFVLDYLGGAMALKGATFNQHNHYYASGQEAGDQTSDAGGPQIVKRRGRPAKTHLNGDRQAENRSAGHDSAARELALRLVEHLSSTPTEDAALMLELECTPEELDAAVEWLIDEQALIVVRTSISHEGQKQPATALGSGQMPRVRKLLELASAGPSAGGSGGR